MISLGPGRGLRKGENDSIAIIGAFTTKGFGQGKDFSHPHLPLRQMVFANEANRTGLRSFFSNFLNETNL